MRGLAGGRGALLQYLEHHDDQSRSIRRVERGLAGAMSVASDVLIFEGDMGCLAFADLMVRALVL